MELALVPLNYYQNTNMTIIIYSTAPDAPPGGVSAQAQSSTTILVRWMDLPEADRNGIITMYEVDYVYDGGPQLQANASASSTDLVLKNLAENEAYTIRVRAFTSAGPGPFSDPVVATTPEDGEP